MIEYEALLLVLFTGSLIASTLVLVIKLIQLWMVVCGCSLRQKLPPEPQRNLTCPLLGGKTWKLVRALFHATFYKGHIYHYLVESVQKSLILRTVIQQNPYQEENLFIK